MQWQIGVDEAGRGALAGPVGVGVVLMPSEFDWRECYALVTRNGEPILRDSKKLSAQQRAIIYEYITSHGRLRHASALVGADTIDEIGIVNATHEAVSIALSRLETESTHARVLLDAGLKAPNHWEQASFIRGDERFPVIAFASIIAKVTRDRHMEELAVEHGGFGFEQHKGYGTLEHRKAILRLGAQSVHRRSFLGTLQA